MQVATAIPAFLSSLGAGAGATSVGAATAAGNIATAATIVSTAGGLLATLQARQAAKDRARALERSAQRRLFTSQVEAQDEDLQAAAVLEEQMAQQAASGLDLSSGSFAAARRKNRVTARLNSLRIRQEGELDAANLREEASGARREARQLGTKLIFDTMAGGINTRASLIERSARIDAAKARSITRSARRL